MRPTLLILACTLAICLCQIAPKASDTLYSLYR
jgi:hypothetical protein